jgi:hypothetical protein
MSEFQLTRDYLDARDVESDCASLTQRIEAFRELEPTNDIPLIVREEDARSGQTESYIPEVAVEELTAEGLRSAIAQHGGMIVRNMFSDSEIDTLKHAIDQVLEVFSLPRKQRNKLATPYFSPPGNMASIMPGKEEELASLRYFNRGGGAAMCAEAPSVAEALLQLYEKHGLKNLLTEYLGEPPCLSVKKWVLRRSMLPIEEAGWHQDGAFMGTDINSINLWIPLTECGGDTGAPGMDIVPKRLYEVASSDGATFDWSVSNECVQSGAFDTMPVAPVFNAGDAFFFDHLYLHRTQFREDISKVRYALETWFFGSTTFPKSQVPLAW